MQSAPSAARSRGVGGWHGATARLEGHLSVSVDKQEGDVMKLRFSQRSALAALVCAFFVGAAGTAFGQSNEELLRRIEALEKELKTLKGMVRERKGDAAPAKLPAGAVGSGNDKITLSVSGQVNRAVLFGHDGSNTEVFHVDNDSSSTRVRFVGKGRFDEDLSIGTQIEVQFESNSSASVNQFSERGVGPNNFTERKLEFYVDHRKLGRLWLGQGDTASNGASEVTLSGTDLVSYSGVADIAGGLLFKRARPLPAGSVPLETSNPTVGSAFNQLDGLSRDDRIRYDTPSLMGFRLSASAIADGRWDGAVRYSAEWFDTFKVAAAIAYANQTDTLDRVDGSVSVLHTPTGLNATFAAGVDDFDTSGLNNRDFLFAQLGWRYKFFEIGETRLAVDWFEGTDMNGNGDWSRAFGGGIVQKVDRIATEFYVGARNYEYKREGQSFDDVLAVMAGGRVKF